MQYGLTTITEPTEEPVTLALAKTHLRIDHDDEDALITGWIVAARRLTETHCQKRWILQTVRLTLDTWPADGIIRLPLEPVSSVESVKYLDTAGVLQTVSTGDYQTVLDYSPPIIQAEPDFTWPILETDRRAAVRVEFKTGAANALVVDQRVKAAMMLAMSYWDENRGGEESESPELRGLPAGAIRLLNSMWSGAYVCD